MDRQIHREIDMHVEKDRDIRPGIFRITDRWVLKFIFQTDKQIDKQIDRQMHRETDMHVEKDRETER
jgi:hypothetical protein